VARPGAASAKGVGLVIKRFRVARNPDPDSRLPYLLWLPIDGGIILKARDTWPRASRVFCAQGARAPAGLL